MFLHFSWFIKRARSWTKWFWFDIGSITYSVFLFLTIFKRRITLVSGLGVNFVCLLNDEVILIFFDNFLFPYLSLWAGTYLSVKRWVRFKREINMSFTVTYIQLKVLYQILFHGIKVEKRAKTLNTLFS